MTVFWKILFACVPPTEYWNGWACFIVSISAIGLLTAVIGDLASHFGCTVGLRDTVTAVVFVALGTSIPGKCVFASVRIICVLHFLAVFKPIFYKLLTRIVFFFLLTDTFASKVAAIQDQYADASVGNVTGSNAVNVFLGI